MAWRRRFPMRRRRIGTRLNRRSSGRPSLRRSRRYSRRRGFGRASAVVNRNPITADVLFVKLRYNYSSAIVGGAVASVTRTWRGNSIYDPDYTGTGTQPMGYDQYTTLYDYCVILGSKINLKILPGSDTVCQFCIFPSLNSSSTAVTLALREIPYGRTRTGGIYNIEGNTFITLKNYMSTAKLYCVSKGHIKDTINYAHSASTNPTNQWYWHLEVETQGGAAASSLNFTYDVWIDYYVMFKRRTELNVS